MPARPLPPRPRVRRAWRSPLLAALALWAGPATAQAPCEAVLLEGRVLTGLGPVRELHGVTVDDGGRVLAAVRVDGPHELDDVLLLDGTVVLTEGDALQGLPRRAFGGWTGAAETRARDLRGFPAADVLWSAELVGSTLAPGSGALLRGERVLVRTGEPFAGVGAGPDERWRGLRAFAEAGTRALVVARLEVPGGPSRTALLDLSAAGGGTVLLAAGDRVPAAGDAQLVRLAEHPRALALGPRGRWLAAATLQRGDEAPFGGLLADGQLVVRDGGPGPAERSRWRDLAGAVVALDAQGGRAWIAPLEDVPHTGFEALARAAQPPAPALAVDGRLLARVGRPVEGAPADVGPLASFGAGRPLLLGPAGRAAWFARFDETDPEADTFLFVGSVPLVREGQSSRDGHVLDVLGETTDALARSPNGRWLVVRATLPDGRRGLFRFDLGEARPVRGCDAEAPRLRMTGGRVGAGVATLEVVAAADEPLALVRLGAGPAWPEGRDPCGLPTPAGDLLLARAEPLGRPVSTGEARRAVLELPPDALLGSAPLRVQAVVLGTGGRVRLGTALDLVPSAGWPGQDLR